MMGQGLGGRGWGVGEDSRRQAGDYGLWTMDYGLKRQGQSVLEYAVLVSAALIVIIAGQIYFKRALHGRWKDNADQVGEQFTTARAYTVENRQQSVRKETTGVLTTQDSEVRSGAWSQSLIEDTLPTGLTIAGVDGKEASYTGHETTRRDFVTQQVGARTLGTHGTFDSGQLSETALFADD